MAHEPNKEQEKAFNNVINAIKKAKKLGLVFYGKQDRLVAYTRDADKYIDNYDFQKLLSTGHKVIPFLSDTVLMDSGADDYACYISKSDEDKF